MYELVYHSDVKESLKELDRTIRQRILKKIEWLSENAELINHHRLKGQWKGLYKRRVGDYRIIYDKIEEEKKIIIYVIDHRSKVYKQYS